MLLPFAKVLFFIPPPLRVDVLTFPVPVFYARALVADRVQLLIDAWPSLKDTT